MSETSTNLSYSIMSACRFCILILVLLIIMSQFGCAGKSTKQQLLAQDYTHMPNEEVLLYYYQLNDEIEVSERSTTGSAVSFGFGAGSFGRHSGIGISSGVGNQYVAKELRERRNLVRLELSRRDLSPK